MPDEGGGLGLKVKITPIIDRSKLNNEAHKVETQLNKNIKLSGTGDDFTKKFSKLMPKSFTSVFNSFGGAKGSGGGLGKAAVAGGVAGLAMAGIQGIVDVLNKMYSLMVEASPSLKAILKMLNQGFMMVLRPMGDALAMMLRPIAMFFRVIGRQVMKQFRNKRAELKAEGYSGAALGMALMEEMPTMYLQVLIDSLANVDWGDMWNKYLDIVWTNITERFPAFLATLWQGFMGMRQGLIDALSGLGTWLLKTLQSGLTTAIGSLAGFGIWLYGSVTAKISGGLNVLGGLGTWLNGGVKNAIGDLGSSLGNLGNFIWKMVHNAIASAFNSISSFSISVLGQNIKPFTALGSIPMLDTGGDILRTGAAIVHKGERVLNPLEAASYGNQTINLSVAIPGSVMREAMTSGIDSYFRTKVVARR